MSTTKCAECGGDVPQDAESCPGCQRPVPVGGPRGERSTTTWGLLLLSGLAVVVLVIFLVMALGEGSVIEMEEETPALEKGGSTSEESAAPGGSTTR